MVAPRAALVGLLLALPTVALGWPAAADHGASEKTLTKVTSFDGHQVPITIYRPLAATALDPAAVILHSHGWSGSRQTADGAFHKYIAAGFGVVSIDMRGHGEARSTSEARVMSVDYEIKDVMAVIDHVATLPWVRLDGPTDPSLGAIGGSYGGAYQLLTAIFDDRLDAIAPDITWTDLLQSLAPNGAPKSAWIDLLYGAGNALARVHPTIHQGFAVVQATNSVPDGSVPGSPDLRGQFLASSPKSYPGAIDIPTLVTQGATDTLFNFNQAVENYRAIKATGAPVRFVTHLNGHILNTQGTIPVPAPVPIGIQPPAGPYPCGLLDDLAVDWFREHLLGEEVPRASEVCLSFEDGTTLEGRGYPLPGTTMQPVDVGDGHRVMMGTVHSDETVVVDATAPVTIAGIPRLEGRITSTGPEAIVYWELVHVDGETGDRRIVDAQVTPLRTFGTPLVAQSFSVDLFGVAVKLEPGDELRLVATGWESQFAHNAERVAGVALLDGLSLDLPIVPEPKEKKGLALGHAKNGAL